MTAALRRGGIPELSVVMVTHGNGALITRAVDALAEHTRASYELIVVDNASDPETLRTLQALDGVRLVLNAENRGFGPGTNQGAEPALGEHLVLLNSDAFVGDGWDEAMLERLARPGTGAVVPRLLNEDGSLQEAGGLVALDGTVRLYGEGDDPNRGSYRFARVVDYGSAACLLIKRRAFMALGGFDPIFAPAYYEDVDLCLRLARRGLAVVYEPRASVTHARYGSGDLGHARALSERNRGRFAGRWRDDLRGRPATFLGAGEAATITARDARASPRVLLCPGRETTAAEDVTAALLTRWPQARITCPSPGAAWGAEVEVLDDADLTWLTPRRYHYDVVVADAAVDGALANAIAVTQPQATRIPLGELRGADPEGLVRRFAQAGIAPPAASGPG